MKITSKDIILDTDERIRMHSEPVSLPLSNEDRELLEAMLEYVRNSQDDAFDSFPHTSKYSYL